MVTSKRSRPRRSHVLGGCSTCRRRHVKCDQKRPVCRTCRALGVKCEGYSDQVLWMRTDSEEPESTHIPRGTRRHLYSEQSRLSMSTALGSDLVLGSIDASLAEVDSRLRDPERSLDSDIVIGPFAVLDFSSAIQKPEQELVHEIESVKSDINSAVEAPETVAPEKLQEPSPSPIFDSLSHIDDFLHWSDLLSFGPDQTEFATNGALSMPNDLLFDMGQEMGLLPVDSNHSDDVLQSFTTQQAPAELGSADIDALKDAPALLRHFQDIVIPHIMAIPCRQKSPWKILNVPAAVVTYSDSTFLRTERVSQAKLANLYGLLACSAIHLVLNPSTISTNPPEYWWKVANHAYLQARDHIQTSLHSETQGLKKAKYKDQLMAVCILIQYTIMSGQQQHARCFMIDAERLLRLRGLSKTRISKKARLLHHVYTWLRIVGESTFVLHEENLSPSSFEALGCRFQSRCTPSSEDMGNTEPNPRLDDFLRLETQNSDSDLNIDEPKDQTSGLHDIHLQDSRSYPETLYKQIYGIPETWLSLVSQTTRLANVLETFRIGREAGQTMNLEAWEALQRRSTRLENMICSFSLGRTRAGVLELQADSKPHGHMVEALNAALVIFFYKRIRQTHPAALQGHVDSVITALQACSATLTQDDPTGPGTAWPLFIAGCEAMSTARREAIINMLDRASSVCGFAAFGTARNIITEVWRKQDEHMTANRGESMPSWVDIVKQGQTWPLFC
ncbi:transcriptional regulator family: Fungal Specific TF [Penicillium concentricum]|uniref:Transcriptional regulator family: Fungal Specific TF n=1 Tax=Penicillium concentricum TaxID=293559 RepID=A0A9W9SBR9_9EURO|nr:transcriptional regulator family: Fungal Specific TF [Penicillium concentricum]KAJ5373273.1 transcriptional regulator family: Fungal Specific TF [Penicillium concentricum]